MSAEGRRALSVAFLSPSWPPDGATNGIVTYVDRITTSLRRMGHYASVLSASGPDGDPGPDVYRLERQRASPLSILFDPFLFRFCPGFAMQRRYGRSLLRAAERAIADRGVELLEIEETHGLARIVKPHLKIPVVVHLHGPHFANAPVLGTPQDASFKRRVYEEGIGIARADAVLSVSREILERTRSQYGLPLAGAMVIPGPGPIVPGSQRWRLADCDRLRMLFLGRFDRHKGGDIVIDCMRTLVHRFPGIRLWFVGRESTLVDDQGKRWSMDEYLAGKAPEVAGSIDWLGRQPDAAVNELRRRALVTIVASRYETFGSVVVEAMAYGCPLVATRTGGIKETVVDGRNGLFCRPGDPEDMAAKIGLLLADPNLAARLGHQAGEDAARYHPDIIAAEIAGFHRQVLDEYRSR